MTTVNNNVTTQQSYGTSTGSSAQITAPTLSSATRLSTLNDHIASTANDIQKYTNQLKGDTDPSAISSDTAKINADYQQLTTYLQSVPDYERSELSGSTNTSAEQGFLGDVSKIVDSAQATALSSNNNTLTIDMFNNHDNVQAAVSTGISDAAMYGTPSTSTTQTSTSTTTQNNPNAGAGIYSPALTYNWDQISALYNNQGK